MSNSLVVLQQPAKECPTRHTHKPLLTGRAGEAAYYPLRVLKAILHGIQLTRDQNKYANSLLWDDWAAGLLMSAVPMENDGNKKPINHKTTNDPDEPPHESDIPNMGGGKTHVRYGPINFRDAYLDEYTRQPHPSPPCPIRNPRRAKLLPLCCLGARGCTQGA